MFKIPPEKRRIILVTFGYWNEMKWRGGLEEIFNDIERGQLGRLIKMLKFNYESGTGAPALSLSRWDQTTSFVFTSEPT